MTIEETLACAGGWIIRAIEEFGVTGEQGEAARFLVTGSQLATQIGQILVDSGMAPEGTNATDAIRHVIKGRIAKESS